MIDSLDKPGHVICLISIYYSIYIFDSSYEILFWKFRNGEDLAAEDSQLVAGTVKDPDNTHSTLGQT